MSLEKLGWVSDDMQQAMMEVIKVVSMTFQTHTGGAQKAWYSHRTVLYYSVLKCHRQWRKPLNLAQCAARALEGAANRRG